MNKEANTIRKKVKILTAGLSEEKNKTWKL
jgi:hypothetical protein